MFDLLPHTTSKIVSTFPNGDQSSGTGFFYNMSVPNKGVISLLVSNKHVLRGASQVRYYISIGDAPSPESYVTIDVNDVDMKYVEHPDPDIDLAAIEVSSTIAVITENGLKPYLRFFDSALIPNDEQLEQFTAIENIMMIGYPTGLWDEYNNLPIIRRGITATPYSKDYNNRPEFLIDCACFPGSSGSPILIADEGSYPVKGGGIAIGSRLYLLGLLWGGPQHTATGDIIAVPVPTSTMPVALSKIPTNLGFCIKSDRIKDLVPIVSEKFP